MSRPSSIIQFMESVKPTRIWIEGKCFAVSEYKNKDVLTEGCTEEYKKEYGIDKIDNKYCTSFRLAAAYYEKLQAFNIITIKELEQHTGAEIKVPESDNDEKIVIQANTLENIIDARSKIQAIISYIREKHKPQQFISIPVLSNEIKNNFVRFKELVLKQQNIKGMHNSIFQKPERLHLTVAVFSLFDDVEKNEAVEVLKKCKNDIIDPLIAKTGPLKIKVQGLDCMNSNYRKANITYANAKFCTEDSANPLQDIVNSISTCFYERGLSPRFQENVKLHVTLINTKYRKDKHGKKHEWRRIPFDASSIMKEYKEYDFGVSDFNSIHLSYMSTIDTDTGFYKPLSVVNI